MIRIGVTGHVNLRPEAVPLVDRALRELLASYADDHLIGVSCLAAGADTIFAAVWDGRSAVDRGGTAAVVEQARALGWP